MAYLNESIRYAPWKPEYGARVFKHDAFLSYRRADVEALRGLARRLENDGASSWWDENGDEDLTDRQFIEKIGHAVFHSRYIVACVSSKCAPSEWMNAEFQLGLDAQLKWPYKRVLVALLDEAARVPDTLATCLAFGPSDEEAARLAQYLTVGNRFDFVPVEVQASVHAEFFDSLRDPTRNAERTVSNVELLLGLPWKIESDEFGQTPLMSMRNSLDRMDRGDLASVPGLSSMLLQACFEHALAKKSKDDRANAIGVMARLAQLGSKEAAKRLEFFLAEEPDQEVISMAFRWMQESLLDLQGNARSVALLAIARAPQEAAGGLDDLFLSSLPEAIQCRVRTGRDLDPTALSPKERLVRAADSIDHLLIQQVSSYGLYRVVQEYERLRRAALLFYKGTPLRAVNPDLVSIALDVIERMIRRSEQPDGYPLRAIDLVFDRLMMPLVYCYASQICPERASDLFDKACEVLLARGRANQSKIDAYRSLLADVKEGKDLDEGYRAIEQSDF